MKGTAQRLEATDLPDWARQHAAVVELCRHSLGFADKVRRARTEHWRKYLVRMAERCLANMSAEAL